MSKFIKRLRKISPNLNSCIVLGNGMGYFDDLIPNFNNIFMLAIDGDRKKGRNVIYRENFKDSAYIQDINFVFIDEQYKNYLNELSMPIQRFRPLVYIQGCDFTDKKILKTLEGWSYKCTDYNKDYQIWKSKV